MQFEVKGKSIREKKLIQLETLLNYEIPIGGATFTLWWLIPGEIWFVIVAAAVILFPIFTIVLAVLLFQLQKYGWFFALMFFFVVPLCVIPFLTDGSPTYPIYYVLPLGFFALYSITLRMVISTWDD